MRWLALALIRIYQMTLSQLMPQTCRFEPCCSNYALEAFRRHGLIAGIYLTFRRILRCHPGNPGGYDPVPGKPLGYRGDEIDTIA